MMYDELVKRLREYGEEHCPLDRGSGICGCIDAREAADAIEEMTAVAESYKRSVEAWADEAARAQPRWIPVTERLPEDGSDVLAYLKYEVGGRIAAANYDKGMWQDCVMGGLYRTEEGVVTHWMPIPQPPKKEER